MCEQWEREIEIYTSIGNHCTSDVHSNFVSNT